MIKSVPLLPARCRFFPHFMQDNLEYWHVSVPKVHATLESADTGSLVINLLGEHALMEHRWPFHFRDCVTRLDLRTFLTKYLLVTLQ